MLLDFFHMCCAALSEVCSVRLELTVLPPTTQPSPEQLTGTGRHGYFRFSAHSKLDFHPMKNMRGKTRISVEKKKSDYSPYSVSVDFPGMLPSKENGLKIH